MLINHLGAVTTILIGAALGVLFFYALYLFIIQHLDHRKADEVFLPVFVVNEIAWVVVTCIAPYTWINENVHIWGNAFFALLIAVFIYGLLQGSWRK